MCRKVAQVELCALGTAECPLLSPTKALKAFLVQVPALSVPLSAEGEQFCCLTSGPFAARTFPCCSPWICGSTGRAEHVQGWIQPLLPAPRPASRCAATAGAGVSAAGLLPWTVVAQLSLSHPWGPLQRTNPGRPHISPPVKGPPFHPHVFPVPKSTLSNVPGQVCSSGLETLQVAKFWKQQGRRNAGFHCPAVVLSFKQHL